MVFTAIFQMHLFLCYCSVVFIFQVYPAEPIYPVPSDRRIQALLMDRLNEKPRLIAVEVILPAGFQVDG